MPTTHQLAAVSSLTKSENLATAIGTYTGRLKLPVLIYSMIVFGFNFYVFIG